MKKVSIKRISYKNFKGRSNSIDLTDYNEVYGRNKSGKSTLFNAHLWLLLGSDTMDRNNFELFDNRVEQTFENSKLVEVEEILDVDGDEISFRKTAKQGWTRKRGHEEYERKGTDDYKFYIDGIEKSATEYKTFVQDMFAPIDKLKFILNPMYYQMVDWKSMRKHLEDLIGEIKEEDFKGDYSSISDIKKKFNNDVELMKAFLKPKINDLKKLVGTDDKKGELSIQIDALKYSLPDLSGLDNVQAEINELTNMISDIDKEIAGISKDSSSDSLNQKLSDIRNDYYNKKRKYEDKFYAECDKIKSTIREISASNDKILLKNDEIRRNNARKEAERKSLESRLESFRKERESLLEENTRVKSMVFTEDKCPFCGQTLPEDKLEIEREKFLAKKERMHKDVLSKGKQVKLVIIELEGKIKNLENDKTEEKFGTLTDILPYENELKHMKDDFIPYDNTVLGEGILSEIASIEGKIKESKNSSDTSRLIEKKKEYLGIIKEKSKELGKLSERDRICDLIVSTENRLKENIIELARLEGKLNSVIKYEREKADIIYCRVNGMFNHIKIVMQKEDKNGNMVDTCMILDPDGVDALGTNGAEQKLCGIDIANAFGKFYGINMPMFIDDAERINKDNLPDIDNQTILMYVADGDFKVIPQKV